MLNLLNRAFPPRFDNACRGHPLAVRLFLPVVVVKTGIAPGTIFNGRGAAQPADGIRLDSFGAGGPLGQRHDLDAISVGRLEWPARRPVVPLGQPLRWLEFP